MSLPLEKRWRSRSRKIEKKLSFFLAMLDLTQLANLFAEFAEEDRDLAQAGMDDYAGMLKQEDEDQSILLE